jgi:hypothetical protein
LLPIRCLHRLSLLSLVAIVFRRRPPSFQFIVRYRRYRRCHRCRRRFLSAVNIIIAIYCQLLPRLLSPAPSLVSFRASSLSLSPLVGTMISSGKSVRAGGPYHVFHIICLLLPARPPLQ